MLTSLVNLLLGISSIIFVDILLSGDNAIVIALAASYLPQEKQKSAIVYGALVAIILRILLTICVVFILKIPYVHLVGGILLLWVSLNLLKEEGSENPGKAKHTLKIIEAIRLIVVADLVMSLDNILAIAAVASGNLILLAVGLIISMGLLMSGSLWLVTIIQRFPFISTIGAAFIGYLSGQMIFGDIIASSHSTPILNGIGGMCLLFVLGFFRKNCAFKR